MSTPKTIPLIPIRTSPEKAEFQAILNWPFAERPFYEGQVKRLLQHGRVIVQHLVQTAQFAITPAISDHLFLDVYTANKGAIALYEKCGFVALNPDTPIPDPQEDNETFVIMAKKVVPLN
jgi:hypothetical protein